MKIARKSKDGKTQSVKCHLLNVANLSKNRGTLLNLGNVTFLAGLLHDMGKLSDDFQLYINSDNEAKVDHGMYGAKYIYDMIPSEESSDVFDKITAEIISLIICYHHGGLPNSVDDHFNIPLLKRICKNKFNDYLSVKKEFECLFEEFDISELFSKAVIEIKNYLIKFNKDYKTAQSYYFAKHLLIKILYSILIDSDWLDSFKFGLVKDVLVEDSIQNYLISYIKNLNIKMESFKESKANSAFQQLVFNKRNEIALDCYNFANNKTGIYTLTVPTGGGKTLSSLNFALNHAKINNKTKIIYVAPYTSILEQNAKVVRETLKCNNELLEFHSNVIEEIKTNDEYEDEEHVKVLSSRWEHPIIFTTVVQFLNIFFSSSSQDLRKLQSLMNSVIIFDEAQSVPIHCSTLFNEVCNYLSRYLNCTIVLCTATQPLLHKLEKPIQLSNNNEIVSDVNDAYSALKRVEVIDKTIKGGYSSQEAVDFILKVKETNKSVLFVVNTIKAAENLFNYIKHTKYSGKIYYLCSNICPMHRSDVISQMKNSLDMKEDMICISTQVIECGVDISFDAVIRSLSGLDSIAQAAGRCNRHGEKKMGKVYVVNLDNELENTSKILSINIGKLKANNILDIYRKQPDIYDNSLLSAKAIEEYFAMFIKEGLINEQHDYFLEKEKTTIYKLLSLNNKHSTYNDFNEEKYPLSFCYQFKTAAKNFKVIEDNTKSIIVPYEEGKDIISELLSSSTLEQKYEAINKSQNYLVNIFQQKYIELNKLNAFKKCEIEGVFILKEGFYCKNIGITLDKYMEPNIQ